MKLTRGERFKDARTVLNQYGSQTMAQVSEATGVSASCIKDLEDDEISRNVGFKQIAKLAKHYKVSTDYLLGLSETNTQDKNLAAVCEYTGLSERSICELLRVKYEMQLIYTEYSNPIDDFISSFGYGLFGDVQKLRLAAHRLEAMRPELDELYKTNNPDVVSKDFGEAIMDFDFSRFTLLESLHKNMSKLFPLNNPLENHQAFVMAKACSFLFEHQSVSEDDFVMNHFVKQLEKAVRGEAETPGEIEEYYKNFVIHFNHKICNSLNHKKGEQDGKHKEDKR